MNFEGLLPCFEAGEVVTKFLLLVLEGLDEVSVEEWEWKVAEEFSSFLIWWRAYFVLGTGWWLLMRRNSRLWRWVLENFTYPKIGEGCVGSLEGDSISVIAEHRYLDSLQSEAMKLRFHQKHAWECIATSNFECT